MATRAMPKPIPISNLLSYFSVGEQNPFITIPFLISLSESRKRFIRFVLLLAATIGFSIQVVQVSRKYFAYRTLIQTSFHVPRYVSHHSVAFCVSYRSVIDLKRFSEDMDIPEPSITNMTIEQIFKYTPSIDILDRCYIRIDEWNYKVPSGKECLQFVEIRKYLTQNLICYRFKSKLNSKMILQTVTQSEYFYYAMYTIRFNKALTRADYISIISFRGDLPYLSRDFGVAFTRQWSSEEADNYFYIYSADYDVHRLPSPHDTRCINRDVHEMFQCRYSCLLDQYKREQRIPVSDIITDHLKHKIISFKHMAGDPFLQANVSRVQKLCLKRCMFHSCVKSYTKTTIDHIFLENYTMGFYTRTPIDPITISERVPSMRFVEFFSFLCGCFGIWYGVSFMSVAPFTTDKSRRLTQGNPFQPFVVNILNPSERVARILSRR